MSTSSEPADVDVDAVVAAVVACPSVAHLVSGGPGEQIATFLPGRRIGGIRVGDDAVEVHVATRWDVPIPAAAAEIRTAVGPLAGGRAVTVAVDDIDDPQAALPAASASPPIALEASSAPGGTPPLASTSTGAAVARPSPGGSAVTPSGGSTVTAPGATSTPAGPPDAVPSPS